LQIKEKVDGEFKYFDQGSGPIVLILHGLFGTLSNFEEIINLSGGRFRFVMPILPIYDSDIKDANIDGMLTFLQRFIAKYELRDYTLLGNSLGGHIALMHELSSPQLAKAMVLTGSSGLFENALGSEYPRRDKVKIKERILEIFGNKDVVTDEIIEEAYDIVTNYAKVLRVLKMAKSAVRHNLTHEIEKIKTKTLLIWGEIDTITPPFVAHQFHEKLINSELKFIPNCGHAPMMEYPKEFSSFLFPFLDQIYANDKPSI
jgi:pimeloyl-ACP methyl ester carboxylesterase